MKIIKKLLFLFIFFFLLFSLTKNFFDYRKNLNFYQNFKDKYEAEKKKNIELKTQFARKNDPYEIEKNIRNKLNLSKPGETAIILPSPVITPVLPSPTPIPFYLQWWQVFTKK